VRIIAALVVLLSLAACNRGLQSNDAVRLGVADHMAKAGMSVDVKIVSVQFAGSEADATVMVVPKGGSDAQGMSMKYHLKQDGDKWAVVGRPDSGSPHGGAAVPPQDAPNPHGGAAPAPGGAGKMPSPDDLPPATPKK
jgi:hypothetical protein